VEISLETLREIALKRRKTSQNGVQLHSGKMGVSIGRRVPKPDFPESEPPEEVKE